jgi:4-amino-4-deoxy-L-arabinose transferase-like glycosyltransferase
MKFELDHDWQGNMSSPRSTLGEKTKIHLFLLLSVVWIFTGLVGNSPWIPAESENVSMVMDIVSNNSIIAPLAASQDSINNPPLYPFIGATFVKIFSSILSPHDAIRLSNFIWISLTLMAVGLMTRELWGIGFGRQAGLIFIASIGLILNVHSIRPEVAALLGFALALYGFALYQRRPFRASLVLGFGISIIFLSNGVLSLLSIFITALTLLFNKQWRNKRYYLFCLISTLIALCIISPWVYLLYNSNSEIFFSWINKVNTPNGEEFFFYIKNMLWFTWPALPLFIFVLIKNFKSINELKKIHLPLFFSISILLTLSLNANVDQINLMPLLLPFSVAAAGGIDLLRRSSASALNWFGILIFGFFGFIIWFFWFAAVSRFPEIIYDRIYFLSGNYEATFEFLNFIFALLISGLWLYIIFNLKISNRSAISNWAIGITMVWVTFIMLVSPLIDNRKSYAPVFQDVKQHLSQSSSCLYTYNFSSHETNLLHYYSGIKAVDSNKDIQCRMILLSLNNESKMPSEYETWSQVWSGKRINRDKTYYILLIK